MKVLFMTNIPSPYRVDFFNELGKYCDLTVTFEGKNATDRNENWISDNAKNYYAIFLKGFRVKSDQFICFDILKILKRKFDCFIVGGYSTPTSMLAIWYMKKHKIKFGIEADGGLISNDSKIKLLIKKYLISSASYWLSSGEETTRYLVHYGANEETTYIYPFTSLKQNDIVSNVPTKEEKIDAKRKIGVNETDKMILSVGRFSYNSGFRKGYDILMRAIKLCPKSYQLYIVGDEPTTDFIKLKKNLKLKNVSFIGFKTKQELREYYIAADLFCLQSREDIWGLVINEAMAYGLPVISTNKCVAAMELVKNGENGYIVDVEDKDTLYKRIEYVLKNDELRERMSINSLDKISNYTIEQMALVHNKILQEHCCGI